MNERTAIAWHTQQPSTMPGEVYCRYRISPSPDEPGIWIFERLPKIVGQKPEMVKNEILAKFSEEAFRGIELIYKVAYESPPSAGDRLAEALRAVLTERAE